MVEYLQESRFQTTLISTSNKHRIVVRGHDLVEDVMGHITFSQMICLLSTGKWLNEPETQVFDAALVALIEHGLTRPAVISRATWAAAPDQIQGAVAAGLLGISGSSLRELEDAGRNIALLTDATSQGREVAEAADDLVATVDLDGSVPGFSTELDVHGNRRVTRLRQAAERSGLAGNQLICLNELQYAFERRSIGPLSPNVAGTVAALLSGIGISWQLFRGFAVICGTGTLVAQIGEERLSPITKEVGAKLKAFNGIKEFSED